MKASHKEAKNICQNGFVFSPQQSTCFVSPKMPVVKGVLGLFREADSDKESSHVVGKFSHAGV